MNNTTNYRIFVEKLPRFRVEAESLRREPQERRLSRVAQGSGRLRGLLILILFFFVHYGCSFPRLPLKAS